MSETAPEDVESPRPPRVEQLLTEGGALKAPDTPEKTRNYVHASARSPLFDNIKFVFMYGIVQHRVGRITDWGENTLFCYLVHPFGLKLVYKPLLPVLLFAANGVAFAPLRNLLLFLILSVLPLVVQIGLCHLSIVLKATYQKWKNRKEPRPSKEAAADVVVSAK